MKNLSSKVKEKKIKEIIKKYLENKGYFVPKVEFDVGIRRPDVVGFKWIEENEYEIDVIAIECKKTNDARQLLTPIIINYLRELQKFFPNVYLASPKVENNGLNAFLKLWRIGYYPIDVSSQNVIENYIIEAKTSPVLDGTNYLLQVRQRVALILTYIDVFNNPEELEVRVSEPGIVWCFKREPANYCAGNGLLDNDYHFGINIEETNNVKKVLNIDQKKLFKIFKDLPGDYSINLNYIDVRRPREVSWTIFHGKINKMSENEFNKLINMCKEKNYNIRLYIHKRIWFKDEVLSRTEHKSRVENAKKELEPLKSEVEASLQKNFNN
jgi:ribulose bisphosphate carboxylase small subunit